MSGRRPWPGERAEHGTFGWCRGRRQVSLPDAASFGRRPPPAWDRHLSPFSLEAASQTLPGTGATGQLPWPGCAMESPADPLQGPRQRIPALEPQAEAQARLAEADPNGQRDRGGPAPHAERPEITLSLKAERGTPEPGPLLEMLCWKGVMNLSKSSVFLLKPCWILVVAVLFWTEGLGSATQTRSIN